MSSVCPVTIIISVQTRQKNAAVASGKSSTASTKRGDFENAADKMKKMTTIFVKRDIFIFQNATAQTISFDDPTISFIL